MKKLVATLVMLMVAVALVSTSAGAESFVPFDPGLAKDGQTPQKVAITDRSVEDNGGTPKKLPFDVAGAIDGFLLVNEDLTVYTVNYTNGEVATNVTVPLEETMVGILTLGGVESDLTGVMVISQESPNNYVGGTSYRSKDNSTLDPTVTRHFLIDASVPIEVRINLVVDGEQKRFDLFSGSTALMFENGTYDGFSIPGNPELSFTLEFIPATELASI